MPALTARSLALEILNGYQPQKSNLSQLIASRFSRLPQDFPDRGFARDLVWGAVRYLNTLDWFIDQFADEPERMEPAVRNILRIGLLQVLFLSERVPHYAAVDESVNLATASGKGRASKLVNAVLRNIIRKENDLPWPAEEDNPVKSVAVRHAHPGWMVARWLKRYGKEETVRLCQADNTVPHLTVRVNTLKITREALKKRLSDEGIASESTAYSPDGLILLSNPELEKLESYRQGLFIVQDEASQLVTRILDPQPGETVIDLCFGVGVKTTHIAQLTGCHAQIMAVDNSTQQIEKAKENFARMGIGDRVTAVAADARTFSAPEADRVLVDAPCSGLGVIRRKPDIKWNRSEEDVESKYPPLQKSILFNGARLVKKGGVIVYSTCTIEPEENEDVIKDFLLAFPDFRLDPVDLDGQARDLMNDKKYFFATFPHRHGTDGFFAARLRRR